MPQEYTEYQIDPDNSERIPAAHWAVYQADKAAYLANPQAAIDAFAVAEAAKAVKPRKTGADKAADQE